MPLIETNVIPGADVYGVAQVSYTVEGESGRDFSAAIAAAAFKQAVAIEKAAASYSDVVRERERKVDELGEMQARLSQIFAMLKTENPESDDLVLVENADWLRETARRYGISITIRETSVPGPNGGSVIYSMTRGNVMRAQNDVQHAVDVEDNNLQQDVVALQGLISKRDNAFSTASRIVKKADGAAASTIQNIG